MNPYVKIAIGAAAAVYLSPPIVNRFVIPEINGDGALRNTVVNGAITGLLAAGVFVLLTMASA